MAKNRDESHAEFEEKLMLRHKELNKFGDNKRTRILKDLMQIVISYEIDRETRKAEQLCKEFLNNYSNIDPEIVFKVYQNLARFQQRLAKREEFNINSNKALELGLKIGANVRDLDYLRIHQVPELIRKKKYTEALALLDTITSKEFEILTMQMQVGVYIHTDSLDKANKTYNSMLNKKDISVVQRRSAQIYVAAHLLASNRNQAVIDLIEEDALALEDTDDGSCGLKMALGTAYIGTERYKKALSVFEYVSNSEDYKKNQIPYHIQSYIRRLQAYNGLNNYKAFDSLKVAHNTIFASIKMNDYGGIRYNLLLADNFLKKKQFDAAFKKYKEVYDNTYNTTAVEVNKLEILSGLAKSASSSGKINEGIQYYELLKDHIEKLYNEERELGKFTNNVLKTNFDNKMMKEKAVLDEVKITLLEEQVLSQRLKWVVISSVFFLLVIIIFWQQSERAKRRLKRAYKLLEVEKTEVTKLVNEREKLLAHVTHQSKTPLVNMNYMLDILDKIKVNEDTVLLKSHLRKTLDLVNNQMEDILNWIKTVLDANINQETVDLHRIVQDVIKENTILSEDKNLIIKNLVSPSTNVKTNPEAFKIIVNNLLVNAIKYSYQNNDILINFKENVLTVVDFGEGIPLSTRELILSSHNPMESTSPQNKSLIKGSGLGFYLVKDLCEKLKLDMDISESATQGTRVSIAF